MNLSHWPTWARHLAGWGLAWLLLVLLWWRRSPPGAPASNLILGPTFVLGLVAMMVVWAPYADRKRKARFSLPDEFTAHYELRSADGVWRLYVDGQTRRLFLLNALTQASFIYGARDILDVQVAENGHTVMSTSTGSLVGRATVGGMVLGPVGALLGGLTAQQRASQRVERLELLLSVRDLANPLHRIGLLMLPVTKDSGTYQHAAQKADEWHARLLALKEEDLAYAA